MHRTLLLVTGAGRSGTSTIAGTLSKLGVHVPGPFLEANASNPKGFYESRWSVQFHNHLLRRSNVSIADGRPEARERLLNVVTQQDRDELRTWLDETTQDHGLTVVKDPRTIWTLELLRALTTELGIDLVSLTMLRHPAEVLGSRATHYTAGIEQIGPVGYSLRNLAGWTNALLMTERQTRGWRRAFVRYDELLTDWRPSLSRALYDLELAVVGEPDWRASSAVDEFIDPDLSRHRLTWDDVETQTALREVADRVWEACGRLVEQQGHDERAEKDLDEAAAAYAELYTAARHLAHDAIVAEAAIARKAGARNARRRMAEESQQRGSRSSSLNALAGRAARRLRRR